MFRWILLFVSSASCPDSGHDCKEPGSSLFATSLQIFLYMDEIPPKHFLVQLSQSLLIGEVLQSLNHLIGP